MSEKRAEERKITHTRERFGDLPETPGAYELICSGYTVYVGHTVNIRQRIKEKEAERVIREWRPNRPRISTPES